MARPKPPTIALSAFISFLHRSLQQPVPIFPHRLTHSASGRWLGAMSRFSTLCRNYANLLYFDYAARATVLLPVIMANPINERCSCSACLHTCSTCCQNQISPYKTVCDCKSNAFLWLTQEFGVKTPVYRYFSSLFRLDMLFFTTFGEADLAWTRIYNGYKIHRSAFSSLQSSHEENFSPNANNPNTAIFA